MRESNLQRMVDAARHDPVVAGMIRESVLQAFLSLGWNEGEAKFFIESFLLDGDIEDLRKYEQSLRHTMPLPGMENLASGMEARANLAYSKIRSHIRGSSVLDLGGGSGEIGACIARDGYVVCIADVRDWRRDDGLRFVQVRDNVIDLPDMSWETVVVLHVYHHSNDPEALLADSFRVASRRVIIIESVTDDMTEFLYMCWWDWFHNRVMHYSENPADKTPVPCRFLSTVVWEQTVWRLLGLSPVVSQRLECDQVLSPVHHRLYVFDKK
ncbi:MAG: methyltransferase domain-containing protein [Patescibacteria group bacterium]